MTRVVVIGAGIGGLSTAAVLARAGVDVTVLEAHIYPGGCAGTFFHQGYRFDAGATLAGGFYPGGPMDRVAQAAGIPAWEAYPAESAMAVHLPESDPIFLSAGEGRWETRAQAFGPGSEPFFHWQERTADALWDLALQSPHWPPDSPGDALRLFQKGFSWLARDPKRRLSPGLLADAFRPVAAHLQGASDKLRLFADAQLLISAQTTSRLANALYGAAALDLSRRGVVHLKGGMGAIAQGLARSVRQNGGRVYYRQEAVRVILGKDRPQAVKTRSGETFTADTVIFNLPVWNISGLFGDDLPGHLGQLSRGRREGWGAFVVFAGLDGAFNLQSTALHHQIVLRPPPGEGNSVFCSISPEWDTDRAPQGGRAVTLSTHTALEPWWKLFQEDRGAYEARRAVYTDWLMTAAESVLPGFQSAAKVVLPGTPVTFQRYTRRAEGWVGGFPQTSLFRAYPPALGPGLWMVGDSIFPGQSVPAVALGGLRVAEEVKESIMGEHVFGGKGKRPTAKTLPFAGWKS
jgi:C-3',4' desaturase CrtD